MKQDTEKTIVVFRKFKEGDIIALFPAIPNTENTCLSYLHIGQHGGANYSHCIRATTPATPAEYDSLRRELEQIGYSLEIRKRYTEHHN